MCSHPGRHDVGVGSINLWMTGPAEDRDRRRRGPVRRETVVARGARGVLHATSWAGRTDILRRKVIAAVSKSAAFAVSVHLLFEDEPTQLDGGVVPLDVEHVKAVRPALEPPGGRPRVGGQVGFLVFVRGVVGDRLQ